MKAFPHYAFLGSRLCLLNLSDLRRRLIAALDAALSMRPATPDELAAMLSAPGQLPSSIGDQAIFDDAVSGLPLVKAERAAEVKRREKAPPKPGGFKLHLANRKPAKAKAVSE